MKLEDIKIGQTYNIVGDSGGCNESHRCKDCFSNPIKVTGFKRPTLGISHNGRIIIVEAVNDSGNHCSVNPDDLEPLFTSWKNRYGGKK